MRPLGNRHKVDRQVDRVQNDSVLPCLRSLKAGTQVTLDVAHLEGEKLALLALTAEHREPLRKSRGSLALSQGVGWTAVKCVKLLGLDKVETGCVQTPE